MRLSLLDNAAIAAALRGATPVSAIVAKNRGMPLPGNVDPLAAAVMKSGQSPQDAAPTDQATGSPPPPTVIQAPSDMGMGAGAPGSGTIGAIGSSGAPLNDQFAQALMQKGFAPSQSPTSPWDMIGRLAEVGAGHHLENQYLGGMQDSNVAIAKALAGGGDLNSILSNPQIMRNPKIAENVTNMALQQADPLRKLQIQEGNLTLRQKQAQIDLMNSEAAQDSGRYGQPGQPPTQMGQPTGTQPMPAGGGPAAASSPDASVARASQVSSIAPDGTAMDQNGKPVWNLADMSNEAKFYRDRGLRHQSAGLDGKPYFDAANAIEGRISNVMTTNKVPASNGGLMLAPGASGALTSEAAAKVGPKEVNGRIYERNPTTGQWEDKSPGNGPYFPGTGTDAIALNHMVQAGTITQAQADDLAAGKSVVGPNGPEFVPASKILADNAPGGAGKGIQLATSKPTEFQSKNIELYNTAVPLLPTLDQNFSALGQLGNQIAGGIGGPANFFASSEYQQARNALRTIIPNYLYSVSGATANPGEVDNLTQAVMPQFGDKPEVLAQKQQQIHKMVDGIRSAAQLPPVATPPPAGPPPAATTTAAPASAPTAGGPAQVTNDDDFARLPSGTLFIGPDGKTRKKP